MGDVTRNSGSRQEQRSAPADSQQEKRDLVPQPQESGFIQGPERAHKLIPRDSRQEHSSPNPLTATLPALELGAQLSPSVTGGSPGGSTEEKSHAQGREGLSTSSSELPTPLRAGSSAPAPVSAPTHVGREPGTGVFSSLQCLPSNPTSLLTGRQTPHEPYLSLCLGQSI